MFKNRKLIGVVDGVSWEMSKEEHEALTEHLNRSRDAKDAFAKLINCELSFESESMQNVLENNAFSKDYVEQNEPLTPDVIECFYLDQSDECRINFSAKCIWNHIPINQQIRNQEDFYEACDGWPSDLLDILWLNEKGLKLAPEMEEIGIDSKSVTIDDEGGGGSD